MHETQIAQPLRGIEVYYREPSEVRAWLEDMQLDPDAVVAVHKYFDANQEILDGIVQLGGAIIPTPPKPAAAAPARAAPVPLRWHP